MMRHRLYILVEGPDDERFFRHVLQPHLESTHQSVRIVTYSQRPRKRLEALLKGIHAEGADYIYVCDINSCPCVTARKETVTASVSGLKESQMVVVVPEIESWYLAGVDDESGRALRLRPPVDTNSITKEAFNSLIPQRFSVRTDFMVEVLKSFSLAPCAGMPRSPISFADSGSAKSERVAQTRES